MTKPSARMWLMALLILAVTAVNVAMNRIRRPRPITMSDFSPGQTLPKLKLTTLTGVSSGPAVRPLPTGCRLLVLFNTTCPHCHTAALMEAGLPDSIRMPVLWISDTDDERARNFAASLNPATAIRYGGSNAFKQLRVRGVPTVFLVSTDDRVLFSSAYSGRDSDHRVLRGMCPA